jgi:hypothetical protein
MTCINTQDPAIEGGSKMSLAEFWAGQQTLTLMTWSWQTDKKILIGYIKGRLD